MSVLKQLFDGGDKGAFNLELKKEFEKSLDLSVLLEVLKSEEINLTRKQVIGKLSFVGCKNIVPKTDKPKTVKDDGPSKKELIKTLADLVDLAVTDLLTFNNVKKSEIDSLISAIECKLSADIYG
jgi:hypothetical protein